MTVTPHRNPYPFRTSLARRASLIIITLCALVGIAVALGGVALVRQQERARIEISLSQLLETIDRPARIAAFTSDATLAAEVVAGLQRNRLVSQVIIQAGQNVLVSTGSDTNAAAPLVRALYSPFDDGEIVGRISIAPNKIAIDADVARTSEAIAALLGLMVAALAAAVSWVVQITITRPIKAVSDALHRMDANAGERLKSPSGNEANELGRLVEDVNALVDRVARREHIFRSIVNQALDAITLIDIESDRFVEFNESAHADLGLSREDFAGMSAKDWLWPARASASSAAVWKNQVYEIRASTRDGELDLRVSTRLIFLDGRPHVVCTWSNITHQKAVQEELRLHRDGLQVLVSDRTRDLQTAKEAAEEANRSKSEFLSNMSHELRTPMHAILSFARLGVSRAEQASTEKLKHYFASVVTSGQRLLTLLNDLLDLSKLEAGMMVLDCKSVDFAETVHHIITEFQTLANEKSVALSVTMDTEKTTIPCDALRIHQVMTNLVSNALKFSSAGGAIHITVEDGIQTPGIPALVIKVKDRGIGIPEAELEKVFDKFVQSSKTRSGAGGTGLGLSITREIIALHGGTIHATNNPEGGACFTLTLPRRRKEIATPQGPVPEKALTTA